MDFENRGAESPPGVNRSVACWQNGKERRVFLTAGSQLICLDASSGRPVRSFGRHADVGLTQGLGRDISGLLLDVTTPGAVYKNLTIVGSEVREGPGSTAPGRVRAYAVQRGEMAWIFHTIPLPAELGHETFEGDSCKTVGGANDWGGMTVDKERGWIFLATVSAAFDFYGGQRPGEILFANCVLTQEAPTGKRVWHYRVVHHDLWDLSPPCPPCSAAVNHSGRRLNARVQASRLGRLYALECETGKPLLPVDEQPTPASDLPGETTWPTQRYLRNRHLTLVRCSPRTK